MKEILPQSVWLQGIEYKAQYIQCTGTYDNYKSQATVYFQLFTMLIDVNGDKSPAQQVSDGFEYIQGQAYIDWGNIPANSINEWIYNWTAQQINVTIIP
jgi:hypothetical protein